MSTILVTQTEPCQSKSITGITSIYEAKPLLEMPCRKREGAPATFYRDDYDTYMNGIFIQQESYGIFAYMIVQTEGVKVKGNDNIFITSEPRNLAPLEVLTVYHLGRPFLAVYDWGSLGHGYHLISYIDDDFLKRWGRIMTTPSGEKVNAICFQNFYNTNVNANQVLLCDAGNRWGLIYESKTKGRPAPAPSGVASGWSVFEYKKHKISSSPWASVGNMLGIMGIQIMDANGNWHYPMGNQSVLQENTELNAYYQRVFTEPNISSAYRSK